MSHHAIAASPELSGEIAESIKGGQRILKTVIENDQFVLTDQRPPSGTWEEDFDALLQPMLEEKKPCYVFYRMDTKDDEGFKWLFISYIPDNSEIRHKMLYSGAKSTMHKTFGESLYVNTEFRAKSEVTLEACREYLAEKA